MSRRKLTEEQKLKILADYAISGNKSLVARLNGISETSVRRILAAADTDLAEKVEEQKEANIQSMRAYMDSQMGIAQSIIGRAMSEIAGRMEEASPLQCATIMGIVIDKFKEEETVNPDVTLRIIGGEGFDM